MQGFFSHADKTYYWAQSGKRFICDGLEHPGGSKSIRFRSVDAMSRHVENMRGKALTHTHKARRSAQKSRRNRGRK